MQKYGIEKTLKVESDHLGRYQAESTSQHFVAHEQLHLSVLRELRAPGPHKYHQRTPDQADMMIMMFLGGAIACQWSSMLVVVSGCYLAGTISFQWLSMVVIRFFFAVLLCSIGAAPGFQWVEPPEPRYMLTTL